MNKLTIGTVQLGMDYGISNKEGKPSTDESISILNYAYNNNIKSFDTAPVYGDSEFILGNWLNEKKNKDILISSKIPSLKKQNISKLNLEKEIRINLKNSMNKLNTNNIEYYLIHDFDDVYYYGKDIFNILKKLKEEGLINNYGCSIYDLKELEYLSGFSIGAIQIPGSIFNQSIVESNLLEDLKKNGVNVFARSAFVQGLIFMEDEEIPKELEGIKLYLNTLRKIIKRKNMTIAEVAFNYIRNHKNVDSVVFGVNSITQLEEIIDIKEGNQLEIREVQEFFSEIPMNLIDPRYWR